MSTYTTQAAIQGEIPEMDLIGLTDDDQTGMMNGTVLNQIITNASGEVDQACANLYGTQLPFDPVPSSVASMALTKRSVSQVRTRLREYPMRHNALRRSNRRA